MGHAQASRKQPVDLPDENGAMSFVDHLEELPTMLHGKVIPFERRPVLRS